MVEPFAPRERVPPPRPSESIGVLVKGHYVILSTTPETLLMAYWKDPEFDPMQRAFYYVRVIEIPTPRWTAYDAKRFGTTMPEEIRMKVQDRAYTSPIWYTP